MQIFLPPVPFCPITLKAKKPTSEELSPYPDKLETLGDHIRKMRLDLKLTAKEVGRRIGVNLWTVYKWEYHVSIPAPRFNTKIIQFLGYEPDVVMRGFYGQKIVAYRKMRGLSQREFAQMLGIHKMTLQQWEQNRKRPSNELLEKLLVFFDITFPKKTSGS